jgi:hypothetical protein
MATLASTAQVHVKCILHGLWQVTISGLILIIFLPNHENEELKMACKQLL